MRTALTYVWAALPLMSGGALTWATFGYAAVRTRRWLHGVAAIGYLAAFIAFVVIVSATSRPDGDGSSAWAVVPFLIAWLGGTVHALLVRRAVFSTPYRALSASPLRQTSLVSAAAQSPAKSHAPQAVGYPQEQQAAADPPAPPPPARAPSQPSVRPPLRPIIRRQRWKAWHVVVIALLLALLGVVIDTGMSGNNKLDGTAPDQAQLQIPALPRVTYELRGTAPSADITIDTGDGGTSQQSNIAIPLRHGKHLGLTFRMPPGSFAYISAQNTGESGWISCYILVNGEVVQSNTSSGAYTIATCSTTV